MIKGEKVYLTAINEDSLEQLREWRNSPKLKQYFREYREISDVSQKRWYENYVLNDCQQIHFEIHVNRTKKMVGYCCLTGINWINKTAEFSIYLGDSTSYGHGYGIDALNLLLNHAFNDVNLNKIWGEVFVNNPAINLFKKIGFLEEGLLKQHHYKNGEFRDSHIIGLLACDWQHSRYNDENTIFGV